MVNVFARDIDDDDDEKRDIHRVGGTNTNNSHFSICQQTVVNNLT